MKAIKLKIKLYRSATVGIDLSGFKILQDPWLTDGEYYGSWSHYPFYDLKSNLNEILSQDVKLHGHCFINLQCISRISRIKAIDIIGKQ